MLITSIFSFCHNIFPLPHNPEFLSTLQVSRNVVGDGEKASSQYLSRFTILPMENFEPHSGLLTTLKKRPFENIVGKGENADNQHFLLLPQCFSHIKKEFALKLNLFCGLQMLSIWTSQEICHLVKS